MILRGGPDAFTGHHCYGAPGRAEDLAGYSRALVSPARKLLDIVRIVAVVDAFLLAPLVYAALTDRESWVSVLGPIHGIGFLLLLVLVVRGVIERYWGWWFPALVAVTLGPPGSLIGDVRIRRALTAEASDRT